MYTMALRKSLGLELDATAPCTTDTKPMTARSTKSTAEKSQTT